MLKTSDIKEVNSISQSTIDEIINELEESQEVDCHLPGGGYLQINEAIPYILVYRVTEPVDSATVRLILSESSYLVIGNTDFEGYRELLFSLADSLSTKFKSFLIFEIFSGEKGSTEFYIKGPADRLSSTFNLLKEELSDIKNRYEFLDLTAKIEDTENRHPEGAEPLLSIEQTKRAGALLIGLEIPPVYRNEDGKEYPVFFRSFKDELIQAVHKTIYDFIRVQTTSGAKSYLSLGQKKLKNLVFEIDKQMADIERSFEFLWLISPANIKNIKESFFSSNYEKLENYHYRLLPIDPDVLKRRLYNLRIEDVEDPAMSYIFSEKREELDIKISMLNERGTKNFFHNSVRLYSGVEKELCEEAVSILENVQEEKFSEEEKLDAQQFHKLAEKEFDAYKLQNNKFRCKVHIREDVNILMISYGELYIPADSFFSTIEAEAMLQHEIGTHVLTHFNGSQQPLEQLSIGLADYETLQEGLAVMAEYLIGGLTANRMRILAGRVLAGKALLNGANFQDVFQQLNKEYNLSPQQSFNITSRIMQGGGFLKDVIYLRGLLQLREHLQKGGQIEPLLLGKYALKHQRIIKELLDRKVIKQPTILPSYFHSKKAKKNLKKIKEGLPLSQLLEK